MKFLILLVLLVSYTCSAFPALKKKFRVALVNLNPNEYWDKKVNADRNAYHLLNVTQEAINQFKDIDLVIYPENAFSTNEVETTLYPERYYPKYPSEMETPRLFKEESYYNGVFDFQKNESNMKVIQLMEEDMKPNKIYSSIFVLTKEKIIARKRRNHLHDYNKYFNSAEDDVLIDTFNTSIGLFAYSSHYDYLFSDLDIIKKNNIKYFIIISSAKSFFPFLHVPSLHAGVAIANNLTVFSASIKSEKDYLLGVGIYDFPRGRVGPNYNNLLLEDFPQARTSQDLVILHSTNFDKILPESISYENEELNLKNLDEPTDGCDIKVTFENPQDQAFYKKATGFNYLNHFEPGNPSIDWGACALVYCPGGQKTCTFPTDLNVKIKSVAVRLAIPSFVQIVPITMESNLNPGQFFYYKKESSCCIELSSEFNQDSLVTFGFIWSYNKTIQNTSSKTTCNSSLNTLQPTSYFCVIMLIVSVIFVIFSIVHVKLFYIA